MARRIPLHALSLLALRPRADLRSAVHDIWYLSSVPFLALCKTSGGSNRQRAETLAAWRSRSCKSVSTTRRLIARARRASRSMSPQALATS